MFLDHWILSFIFKSNQSQQFMLTTWGFRIILFLFPFSRIAAFNNYWDSLRSERNTVVSLDISYNLLWVLFILQICFKLVSNVLNVWYGAYKKSSFILSVGGPNRRKHTAFQYHFFYLLCQFKGPMVIVPLALAPDLQIIWLPISTGSQSCGLQEQETISFSAMAGLGFHWTLRRCIFQQT